MHLLSVVHYLIKVGLYLYIYIFVLIWTVHFWHDCIQINPEMIKYKYYWLTTVQLSDQYKYTFLLCCLFNTIIRVNRTSCYTLSLEKNAENALIVFYLLMVNRSCLTYMYELIPWNAKEKKIIKQPHSCNKHKTYAMYFLTLSSWVALVRTASLVWNVWGSLNNLGWVPWVRWRWLAAGFYINIGCCTVAASDHNKFPLWIIKASA